MPTPQQDDSGRIFTLKTTTVTNSDKHEGLSWRSMGHGESVNKPLSLVTFWCRTQNVERRPKCILLGEGSRPLIKSQSVSKSLRTAVKWSDLRLYSYKVTRTHLSPSLGKSFICKLISSQPEKGVNSNRVHFHKWVLNPQTESKIRTLRLLIPPPAGFCTPCSPCMLGCRKRPRRKRYHLSPALGNWTRAYRAPQTCQQDGLQ